MVLHLADEWAVVASSAAWLGVSLLVGWWGARWPDHRLEQAGPVTRVRAWEDHGRWWQRHLAVRRWKDALPEAGGLFGGFAKRKVPSRATADLQLFRRETIRAERVHWLIAASTPIHLLWCSPRLFAVMVVFGLAFNAPFIVIQRSNRGRIERLIARRATGPTEADLDGRRAPVPRATIRNRPEHAVAAHAPASPTNRST